MISNQQSENGSGKNGAVGHGVTRVASRETLTIFFPMWNEEAYIHATVSAARDACENLVQRGEIRDYEILIIDDASKDATGVIAARLAANDPHVRVIHHPTNRKLGGALKTGFANAKGDLVLYADADLPFDMAEVAKACRLLRSYDADIVAAYRHDRTAEGSRRAVYSFGYNALVRVLFGLQVRDVNFSFKLCRRRIFDDVKLASEGSFVDAELLARAERLGYRIIQFGVDYFPRTRGRSSLSSPSVIRKMIGEMWALRREIRALKPRAR